MKKMLMVMAVVFGLAIAVNAEEFYRPVYGSYTNAGSVVWTNNIGDPVILRNVILKAGQSNQVVTIDAIVNNNYITQQIVAVQSVNALSNTTPQNLFIVLEIGDKVRFNSDQVITNTGGNPNRWSIYLGKNQK